MSIGGASSPNEPFFYAHDANKNVSALVSATDGTLAATYDYDPFGNLISCNEELGTTNHEPLNSFRFSNEYEDHETGFLAYKYRYYDTTTGSWLNRDPIEEQGGVNLYGFVGNETIGSFDIYGLYKDGKHREITMFAYNIAVTQSGLGLEITERFSLAMLAVIQKSNKNQDIDGFLYDARHYSVRAWKGLKVEDFERTALEVAYDDYLNVTLLEFEDLITEPKPDSCASALDKLGRLSHTWQDFYAHAIRRDRGGPVNPDGGSESSRYRGWTAFSVGVIGSPDSRADFMPASWNLIRDMEHPNIFGGEPIQSGAEYNDRFIHAIKFTKDKYLELLPKWWSACSCNFSKK